MIGEIVSALRGRGEVRGLEKTFVDNPAQWLIQVLGGGRTAAGVDVTETNALSIPAFFRSVVAPSETLAALPHLTYRRLPAGGKKRGKERADQHPLYELLHLAPNPEMTSMQWGETGQLQQYLFGDWYSEIVRNGRGDMVALWPIHTARVRPERLASGEKVYVVTVPGSGEPRTLRRDQVLQISGPSLDGFQGLNRLRLHAESIGLDLALREFGSRFFSNFAMGGGFFTHPAKYSDQAKANLRQSIERMTQGLTNAHRFALLEEGLTFHEAMVKPEHGQFLQSREHQVGEHARSAGVPGVVIGHNDKAATYASAEQFFLSYVVHTLLPLAVRRDQACTLHLLTERERRAGLFVETLMDGLLRGDSETRAKALEIQFRNGAITLNEWRETENRNTIDADGGDEHFVPMNFQTLARALTAPKSGASGAAPGGGNGGGDPDTSARHQLGVFVRDVAATLVRKEIAAVGQRAKRYASDPAGFRAALTEFYAEHADEIAARCHMDPMLARAYTDRHVEALERDGVGIVEAWERDATGALTALALGGES